MFNRKNNWKKTLMSPSHQINLIIFYFISFSCFLTEYLICFLFQFKRDTSSFLETWEFRRPTLFPALRDSCLVFYNFPLVFFCKHNCIFKIWLILTNRIWDHESFLFIKLSHGHSPFFFNIFMIKSVHSNLYVFPLNMTQLHVCGKYDQRFCFWNVIHFNRGLKILVPNSQH